MRHGRMEIHAAVGLAAMQVERGAGNGDVRGHERDQHGLPDAEMKQAVREKIQEGMH
ncbi:hypothetical protein D3C71_1723410 [compost metagenome]